MEEQKMMSDEIGELAGALAEAQAELSPAVKNAQNPHLKNRYADIAAVYEAIRETLPKHGLAVSQMVLPHENKARVRTLLMHKSGQWIASECLMPIDGRGGPQGMGSAITYARRYSLSAIVGVVSEDDDDAEAAQGYQQGRPRQQYQQQRQQAQATQQPRPQQTQGSEQRPEGPSEAQLKAMMALFKECGIDVKEVRIKYTGDVIGRNVNSCSELTRAEASKVIDSLKKQKGGNN